MVNLFFIDVTHMVQQIFHFSYQTYFPTRMKTKLKVIFKKQFSLSSLPSYYAVVRDALTLTLYGNIFLRRQMAFYRLLHAVGFTFGVLMQFIRISVSLCLFIRWFQPVCLSFSTRNDTLEVNSDLEKVSVELSYRKKSQNKCYLFFPLFIKEMFVQHQNE